MAIGKTRIKVSRMERYRLSKQEQSFFEGLQTPLAVFQLVDGRAVTLAVSKGFCELLGVESSAQAYAAMDEDTFAFVHPDDVARVGNAVARFMRGDNLLECIYRLKDQYGYRMIHVMGKHIYTQTGERLAHVWYMDEGEYLEKSEGTKLNQALTNALHEESILKASYYDALTGLPTLSAFFELAEMGKAAMHSQGEHAVLLYLDLNGMKYYNYKFSFAEGDRLLQGLSELLSRTFGADHCGHVGADRFTVYTKEDGLEDTLLALFDQASRLNDGRSLPVRVGIYPTRFEDVPISFAYDRAKIACDAVRKGDTSGFRYYSGELQEYIRKSQYIVTNIDKAIDGKWVKVYYQPIVRAVNEKVCDVEALARWIDPVEGFLSPADFIPYLEDAGLIYKLDLYVLEQVLEKIKIQAAEGLYNVPHSINLSRSDFDACDIVEEIRRRVDASGIPRDRITIEITESMIGGDFDFMKEQIERFQKLGFPVWMDDFGSGYSSLDVLQSIRFDLIKFDMGFMKKLDEGDNGKIILTELMKMATFMGVDTICEGVETKEQVRFLQEIGCSKFQGFHFSKPMPLEVIQQKHREGVQTGHENPMESSYYETIGRVNLYDLSVIANTDENVFQNSFNTLPMGIIEVQDDKSRFVRCNQSYRDFIKRFFGLDLSYEGTAFTRYSTSFMNNIVKTCCERGVRAFYDEKMPDGSIVHSFARGIGVNPVSGNHAVAVAVLSISDPDEGASYEEIARALAADYYNIYVVDLDTESFIEYSCPAGRDELAMERRGEDFFAAVRRDTMTRIYEEDREPFLAGFSKEQIIQKLDSQGVYTATYRLIDTGTPLYASLKVTRMRSQSNRIIMGVSIIDTQVKQKEADRKAHEQSIVFGRIAALSGKYYALYIVDPETGKYFEYSVTSGYGDLGFDKSGEDFFTKGRSDGMKAVYSEDLPFFLEHFTRERIMRGIREKGMFQIQYRLVINGVPKPILLKAAMVREPDGDKIVVGVNIAGE